MEQFEQFYGLAGFPIIAALVSAFVKPFVPDDRYYPIAAIALGVALNVAIAYRAGGDWFLGLLLGVVTGLAASGLYDGQKAFRERAPGQE